MGIGVNLYNGIYSVLANDEIILNYLGIGTSASNLEKAQHIQKRSKPQELAMYMPLISFYAHPGRREVRNYEVYLAPFVFDVYTNDDVDLAQNIASRITDLFDGVIPNVDNLISFAGAYQTEYESATDLSNTYCFTVVILFSVSTEAVDCM